MFETPKMRRVDARSVQKSDVLLREGTLIRVLAIEWPYAVVRVFENGEFGPRAVTRLEGMYFIPSDAFLRESGLYESTLFRAEGKGLPGEHESDCVLDLLDSVANLGLEDGSLASGSFVITGSNDESDDFDEDTPLNPPSTT
ncbi:MAG: hypothetical protein AAF517_06415 [Planctomycetota bacterium]